MTDPADATHGEGPATPPDLAVIEQWREELMELGGPNTLIWPRRGQDAIDLTHAHPGGVAMLLAGRGARLSDLVREPDALLRAQRRAIRIAAHATRVREAHGVDIAFLTMGRASWPLPGQADSPSAPVLLRRVTLRRLDTGLDHSLDLADTVEVNPALLTYLRRALRQPFSSDALIDRGWTTSGGFHPEPILEQLRRECAGIPDFRIDPQLVVASHPYGKADTLADFELAARALRAGDAPPALRALATGEAPATASGGSHEVGDTPLPLSLRPDQEAVVATVSAGESVVVHAPAGSGVDQLAAALVADAATRRRRVLVLAERPRVLEGFAGALASVGLESLLGRGTSESRGVTAHSLRLQPDLTSLHRAETPGSLVDSHITALHRAHEPWGVSLADAHDAIVTLAARRPAPRSRVRFDPATLDRLDAEGRDELAGRLTDLAERQAWRPGKSEEPWSGARLEDDADVQDVLEAVDRLAEGELTGLRETVREVFLDIAEPRALTVGDHGRFLADVERVRDTLDTFRPEVFDTPLEPLLDATSPSSEMGLLERRRWRGQARNLLRPGRPPADLHAALREVAAQRKGWARLTGGGGRPRIPKDIERAHRAYERVYADLTHLSSVLASPAGGSATASGTDAAPPEVAADVEQARADLLEMPLPDLTALLERLRRDADGARLIPGVIDDLDHVHELGAGPLLEDLKARGVVAEEVAGEVHYVWWLSLLNHLHGPAMAGHSAGADLDAALQEYVEHDTARQGSRRQRLVDGVVEGSPPIWASTPATVGGQLDDRTRFDLVVVLDGSTTTPARVAAAAARGRQLVVLADPLGLLPTTWTADIGVADPARPAQSLAQRAAEVLPVLALTDWDRARPGQALEIVADQARLAVPPVTAPLAAEIVEVDGRGILDQQRGLVPTTPAEVDAVVTAVRDHLVEAPGATLGVVTFSAAHTAAITSALAEASKRDPAFTDAVTSLPAPVIVAEVERWCGRERDHVVVSTGYGRTPQGRLVTRFGDLSGPDAAQRVANAATRARTRLTWVTAMRADDLTGERMDQPGPAALRRVLHQLGGGGVAPEPLEGGASTQESATRPLVADFVRRLRGEGWIVRVGSGVEPDLAIADPQDPQRWVVAVDIDGAAATGVSEVRQRDRFRAERMQAQGWHPLRLWSSEIFADPARQQARVARAVQQAKVEDE